MTEKRYILAIDEGTTGLRSCMYDTVTGTFAKQCKQPLTMQYPKSGCVQQDAEEIYVKMKSCIENTLEGFDAKEIYGMGVTNQRETVVIWGRDGKPLGPAINWQCRRTSAACERIKAAGIADMIKKKTGLVVDAYFSALKLKWLLDNTKGAREMAAKGELFAGTIDTYLIYRLTGGRSHITDVTNASRTMLFNIATAEWDDELLRIFDIPKNILAKVVECSGQMGVMSLKGCDIPICGIAGDQQAALFGQACFSPAQTKCTYGTGAFLLTNIGKRPLISDSPLITTIAYKHNGELYYALEGSVFNAGSTVQWLRDLGLIARSRDSEACAFAANGTSGVYLVPAFTGLGAPYWDMDARAAIVGISRAAGKNEIVRAGLEAIAYRCYEVFDLMSGVLGMRIGELKADGGAAENKFLMQFQSDLLGVPVHKAAQKEATILGAVYLAGLGSGAYQSIDDIKQKHAVETVYKPSGRSFKTELEGWRNAVASVRSQNPN